jgi:hypothetical protein
MADTLMVALAGYTTSPAAKDNEVECWNEDENGNVVETNVDGCLCFLFRLF